MHDYKTQGAEFDSYESPVLACPPLSFRRILTFGISWVSGVTLSV